jgi:hypothetical protein
LSVRSNGWYAIEGGTAPESFSRKVKLSKFNIQRKMQLEQNGFSRKNMHYLYSCQTVEKGAFFPFLPSHAWILVRRIFPGPHPLLGAFVPGAWQRRSCQMYD